MVENGEGAAEAAAPEVRVRSAIEAGKTVAPEVVVDTFVLPNVHPSIFPAQPSAVSNN